MVDARSAEPSADTGKLHERVIADYQRAYVVANKCPAPQIAYENGWYRFRMRHSFKHPYQVDAHRSYGLMRETLIERLRHFIWDEPLITLLKEAADALTLAPIVTAPRDGTWILGWAQQDSAPYRVSWGRNHNGELAWCSACGAFVPGYISHWMPLPAIKDEAKL